MITVDYREQLWNRYEVSGWKEEDGDFESILRDRFKGDVWQMSLRFGIDITLIDSFYDSVETDYTSLEVIKD